MFPYCGDFDRHVSGALSYFGKFLKYVPNKKKADPSNFPGVKGTVFFVPVKSLRRTFLKCFPTLQILTGTFPAPQLKSIPAKKYL